MEILFKPFYLRMTNIKEAQRGIETESIMRRERESLVFLKKKKKSNLRR